MAHYLKTDKTKKPKLKERKLDGADVVEVECEGCGAFRPGFCINADTTPGPLWECDGCYSKWLRENKPENYR